MKTAIITGASSSIGISLVEECLQKKCKVIALIRKDSVNAERLPQSDNIKLIDCDLERLQSLEAIYPLCEDSVFFHLAWAGTDRERRNDTNIQQKNIRYTLDALKLAQRSNCKKFIGAGSQAEYGIHVDAKTSPDSPVFPNTAYGIGKYAAGRLASILAEQIGMNFFWVRIFSVYGKYDLPTSMIKSTIEKMKRTEHCSFTLGTHYWDYLYSSDAGKALYSIGNRSNGNKIYCLGSGHARPLKEYIFDMRDIIAPGLKVGLGEIPYDEKNEISMCADIDLLHKDTGWIPETDFRTGIKMILKEI